MKLKIVIEGSPLDPTDEVFPGVCGYAIRQGKHHIGIPWVETRIKGAFSLMLKYLEGYIRHGFMISFNNIISERLFNILIAHGYKATEYEDCLICYKCDFSGSITPGKTGAIKNGGRE